LRRRENRLASRRPTSSSPRTTNLRFESVDAATNFRTFLHNVIWQSPEASPALVGAPTARVLTEVTLSG
jgi:hypothetical protein